VKTLNNNGSYIQGWQHWRSYSFGEEVANA